MKTLTEFPALNLKSSLETLTKLKQEGKEGDELTQALGETLKLEGNRLQFLIQVLGLMGQKVTDLKRAVVYALNEGEKAPEGLVQNGEHYFLIEYYPPLNPKGEKKGKFDPRKKGKGKKQRGFKNARRSPRDSDQASAKVVSKTEKPKLSPGLTQENTAQASATYQAKKAE